MGLWHLCFKQTGPGTILWETLDKISHVVHPKALQNRQARNRTHTACFTRFENCFQRKTLEGSFLEAMLV